MTATTRRAALGALVSASALALPTVAIAAPPDADAALVALAAEIGALCARGEEIQATRIDPFEETFQGLLDESLTVVDRLDLSEWPAFIYSREVGRDAAIGERADLDEQADRLWKRMMAIPATTQAGRAAKVRALLMHVVTSDWLGPRSELDWDKEQARGLLGQFAGMSEEELAAV